MPETPPDGKEPVTSTETLERNTHKPWPDGGEVFDTTIEVPVTIRNPDKPFGTHVFAMARNDAGLRWTAVTIDNGDDAKDALDRITIPQDVLDRIAPTALPRSSIIVSDEPLSRETNYRTEFVAVLDNQPRAASRCAGLRSLSPLRAATSGATTASPASFSRAIGTRNLPIRVRAPANTINNRCNSAGGKTRHAATPGKKLFITGHGKFRTFLDRAVGGVPVQQRLMSGYDKPIAGAWEVSPGKKLSIRWSGGELPPSRR